MVTTVIKTDIGAAAPYGYGTLSGTGPASGVSGVGDFSGPFYVEKQTLSFRYKRIPWGEFLRGAVNLSSVNTEWQAVGTTLLIEIYEVGYKVTKVTDWYSTSSYTQGQRFEVFSTSSDETGMTYGAPAAGALGPRGSVVTSRPWYFRRDWVEGVDQEVNVRLQYTTATGPLNEAYAGPAFNYYGYNNHDCAVGPANSPSNINIETPGVNEPQFWLAAGTQTQNSTHIRVMNAPASPWRDTFHCGTNIRDITETYPTMVMNSLNLGWKPGAYDAAQDTAADVQIIVDKIADEVASLPGGKGRGHGIIATPDARAVRNVYYEKTRHYWGN